MTNKEKYPMLDYCARIFFHQDWGFFHASPLEVMRLVIHSCSIQQIKELVGELEGILHKVKTDEELEQLFSGLKLNMRFQFFNKQPLVFISEILDFIRYVVCHETSFFIGRPDKDRGSALVDYGINHSLKSKPEKKHICVLKLLSASFSRDSILEDGIGSLENMSVYIGSLLEEEVIDLYQELLGLQQLKLDEKSKRVLLYDELGLRYSLEYYGINAEIFIKELIYFMSFELPQSME